MTNHALKRARQRMGWDSNEARKIAKISVEKYISINPGALLFEDEFHVGLGIMEWVVINDGEQNFTIVTLRNKK